jgi:hypothetical protein
MDIAAVERLPLSHTSPRPARAASAVDATTTRYACWTTCLALVSATDSTQLNRGLRVWIPRGVLRHSTRRSAGCTPDVGLARRWVARLPCFNSGPTAAPRDRICRMARRLVTVGILRGGVAGLGPQNVLCSENVGINTTMWNLCLHIRNRQCYLYTNRSFACEYVARGHDSLPGGRRAPVLQGDASVCFVRP